MIFTINEEEHEKSVEELLKWLKEHLKYEETELYNAILMIKQLYEK